MATMITWVTNHITMLRNAFLGLFLALSLGSGIFYHNKVNKLSEELKIANNNIEAYQDAISGAQQASGVLQLDMSKLKECNDQLVQKLDSVSKRNNVKTKEIQVAATQGQTIDVTQSKGVGGNIVEIIKDSTYNDSLQYNNLTKIYYYINKDSINIRLKVDNTQYLYVYKHKEYKNKKNFFQRLFTLDWKKKYTYKYKIINTNDLIKEDSVRVIESI